MPSGAAMDKPVANKPTPAAQPTWRLALRVNDAVGLQQTFSKLLSASRMDVKHLAEGKFTVHSFQIPSQPEPLSINYAFADGYLLVGSSRVTVSEALRVHQAGESLAKSAKFRAALPDNQAQVASALYYQNVGSWMSMVMKQLPAEFTQSLPPLSTTDMPSAVSAIYGSDRAIRATGGNNTTNSAVVMVIAAMAIPNLLRARMAADEAAAGASIRTINTAQVTYSVTYPNKGYAADLATLGPGTSDMQRPQVGNRKTRLSTGWCSGKCLLQVWKLVQERRLQLQCERNLQVRDMPRLCGSVDSCQRGVGNKKLLLRGRRRGQGQGRISSCLTHQRGRVQEMAAGEVRG